MCAVHELLKVPCVKRVERTIQRESVSEEGEKGRMRGRGGGVEYTCVYEKKRASERRRASEREKEGE